MEPLSGILFGLFRGSPQHGDWVVACLEGAWPALVSERIALVCRPARFEASKLTIEITDAAWDEPLRQMAPELLQRIRQGTADEVRELRFVPR
jgi:predicted nucleic acid-binding Zn ribbon protein